MRGFWKFGFTLFFVVVGSLSIQAQTDTTKVIKEAPESLRLLLNDIIEQATEKVKSDATLEIDGLLIDETKTKSGRDFFDLFYRDWEPPADARNYSIFVVERPFRANQTLIEVLINETMVYQSFLQPRLDYIEEIVVDSLAITQMYLAQYEELIRELDGEDRKGSGIF
ncbi:MAG: CsgE family curli-type amyloid fiber assembly protein [Mongoliitalea sp.]